MKKMIYQSLALTTLLLSLTVGGTIAVASDYSSGGSVSVKGAGTTKPTDPDKPGEPVEPGPGPSTEGSLRIDYVSALNFGQAQITSKERKYFAQAQLFHGDTSARGSYIQITDEREAADGWTLQVKQNYQFRNTVIQDAKEQELAGAVLSLDKGWANSLGKEVMKAPTVTRDTIALTSIGDAYEVAKAEKGTGMGIWTIEFGASKENEAQQVNTLTPLLDENGKEVIDPEFNKPIYKNSAVSLSIPNEINIHPVQYETEITWILAKLP